MSGSPPALLREVSGARRLGVELGLFARVALEGLRRFGLLGTLRELFRYFRNNRNILAGSGAHYIARGSEVYAASALPPLNSRRFVNYFLDEVFAFNRRRLSPLTWVLLSISSTCPYRCRYCYARDELGSGEQALSLETLQRAMGDIKEMGVPTVFLTGGEPMMRAGEIGAILDAGAGEREGERALSAWLVTTGWGVDVAQLMEWSRRGLVGLVVSLDSEIEEQAVRSKGHPLAFDKAIAAMRSAREAGLLLSVDTMVPHGSPLLEQARFDSFVDLLQREGVHFLNLFPPHPVGAAREEKLKTLSAQDIERLEALTIANNRRPGRPLAYAAIAWERRRGCAGGQQFVHVDPLGEVRPCPFLKFSAGNLRDERLPEIIERMRAIGEQDGCFHAIPGLRADRRTPVGGSTAPGPERKGESL